MNPITRREALLALAGTWPALQLRGALATSEPDAPPRTGMGIAIYALGIHQRQRWAGRHAGLPPALAFLEETRQLGAGGIQCPLGPEDAKDIAKLRRAAEAHQLFIEAIVQPPKDDADVDRFTRDIQTAREAGATLARTVIMPGRRYEDFHSLPDFRAAEARGLKMLQLAAPVVARHRLRLAVENHKDQRVSERLDLLRRVGSEFVGLCVDVGNSFALVEDPLEVVRAYAPHAFSVHIKDHQVAEYPEGFLLADAAMGDGFLDLAAMVKLLRAANPSIHFNLETITRDPLKVPVLTEGYWATLVDVPAADLARTWRTVKQHAAAFPPAVSALPPAGQLERERQNVLRSLNHARTQLGL